MLLAGDIGGTKTHLAVFTAEQGPSRPLSEKLVRSRDYPSLASIASEYLAEIDDPVTEACFAVAGPVVGGSATLTNLPWEVTTTAVRDALGLDTVTLLNDVQAMAIAVPHLQADDVYTLRDGRPVPGGVIAVIAPGTGLGQAFLTWDGARYHAHPSEGSHTDFGPTGPLEIDLLRYLQARWGRVSYERVCAGQAIPDLYDFLEREGRAPESPAVRAEFATAKDRTPIIMAAALAQPDPDPLSREALNLFVSVLGAQAGNLVLTVVATGGLYVGGGIPQRIRPKVTGQGELFLSSFSRKGRLSPLLARVPVHVIKEPVALLGAAVHGLDLAGRSTGDGVR